MRLRNLIFSEIRRHKRSFGLGILAIAVATGTLIGALSAVRAHDARTNKILLEKEQETREKMAQMDADIKRSMEKLGFSMIILPKDQETINWYADNYASKTMPEENARRLAEAKIEAISAVRPVLRQKIEWPETRWSVILAGKGALENSAPIEPGQVRMGHEIHNGLEFETGDEIEIKGRIFEVGKCLPEAGDEGDVTIWMNLDDVQGLTENEGRINEIHLREYRGEWQELAGAKSSILEILPHVRIVERNFDASAKIMAFEKLRERSQAAIANEYRHRVASRANLKKFSNLVTAAAVLICIVWLALLASRNVKERRGEIALLRSVGLGIRQVFSLFAGRLLILALGGGVLGYLAGGLVTPALWPADIQLLGLAVLIAVLLTFIASLAPILRAVRSDPASIFQEAEQ